VFYVKVEGVDEHIRTDVALAVGHEEVVDVKLGEVQTVVAGGSVLVVVFEGREAIVVHAFGAGDGLHVKSMTLRFCSEARSYVTICNRYFTLLTIFWSRFSFSDDVFNN